MKRYVFLGLTLLLIFLAQTSHAARFTGAYLLQVCEKNEKREEIINGGHAVCQSYIAGIIDMHNAMRSLSDDLPSADFCVPPDVSLNHLHGIVLEYLRHNSQHDQYIASLAVVTALYEIYPCD